MGLIFRNALDLQFRSVQATIISKCLFWGKKLWHFCVTNLWKIPEFRDSDPRAKNSPYMFHVNLIFLHKCFPRNRCPKSPSRWPEKCRAERPIIIFMTNKNPPESAAASRGVEKVVKTAIKISSCSIEVAHVFYKRKYSIFRKNTPRVEISKNCEFLNNVL